MTAAAIERPKGGRKLPLGDCLSEKQEEAFADRTARMLGYTVIRFSQPRKTMQSRGWFDRVYVHRAHRLVVHAELKSEKGKLSAHQVEMAALFRDCGQLTISGTANVVGAFLASKISEKGKR